LATFWSLQWIRGNFCVSMFLLSQALRYSAVHLVLLFFHINELEKFIVVSSYRWAPDPKNTPSRIKAIFWKALLRRRLAVREALSVNIV